MTDELSIRANMTTGGIARGGRLTLAGDRLVFGNHKADRALTGDADWTLALTDIAEVDVAAPNRSLGQVFSGGMRSRLRVVSTAGEEALFVVPKPADVAAKIEAARRG